MRLRLVLLEVGEELRIGEMLETGCIVSHDVPPAWEEESPLAVPVAPGMEAGEVAEVGGRAITGDGAFGDAGVGGRVVGAIDDGGVGDVVAAGHDVCLGDLGSVLRVAVSDGAGEVVGGDEAGLDGGR